ncbi:MAG: hypothetical protein AB7N24_09405 [Dehalococcoidia bacterium]
MTTESLDPLLVGQRVETFDHHLAGTVQAINADHVLVKPAILPAYWINEILIRSVRDDTVRLQVDRRRLQSYMQEDAACGASGGLRSTPKWVLALASLLTSLRLI